MPAASPSPPGVRPALPFQARTFDDLATALCDVTFCVLDIETTGASPAECAITEMGAV